MPHAPFRIALIGAGGMAGGYRKIFGQLPGAEWRLAVDVSDETLAECSRLGAQRVSTSFEEALKDDIDVVVISTPNHLHEPQSIAALNAGKHVLCEKPITNTLEGADNILRAEKSARGKFGMYMSSYTQPAFWDIKKMIDGGALGKIQSVRARDAHTGGLSARKEAWRGSREKTGGGCFIQLSVHSINLMHWWLGAKIEEVRAFSANQYCENIGGDDVTTATVRYSDGILGVFESGWASSGAAREIYGSRGYIRMQHDIEVWLDAPWQGAVLDYTTPEKPQRFAYPPFDLADTSNPHNQHVMFLNAIRENKPPHMSAAQGRHDLAVVLAAYRSAESGKSEKAG